MNISVTPKPQFEQRSDSSAAEVVLRWVRSRADARPVPEHWVPGATSHELIQVGALGELSGAVLRANGGPTQAFAVGNLRRWIDVSDQPNEDVVAAFQTLLASDAEQNLAALYSAVVSGPSRRTLGTFFTPADEAEWMVHTWDALFPPPSRIVDVGAGVGIFSTRAAETWSQAEIFAVDVNPITLGLLALCVQSRDSQRGNSGSYARRIIPVESDFTLWIDRTWKLVPGPRLILGNPPYTRLQLMPAAHRGRLTKSAGGLVGSRAALSAVITAQSLLALEPADGMALLLPAQWLEADYAEELRTHLWNQTNRRVELRVFGEQLFADATVDAVALLVGPEETTPQPLTVSGSESTKSVSVRNKGEEKGFERIVASARARTALPAPVASAPLSDFVRVRRGVATGSNRFFILDEAAVEHHGLSEALLTPMLRRTKSAPVILTEDSFQRLPERDRRWLLTVRPDQVLADAALQKYISVGEKHGMNAGLLCRRRENWFDLHHDLSIPDLIISQSSKKGFTVVENQLGAATANNLYGMRWSVSTSRGQRLAIIAWLRGADGQGVLRSIARVQATGLLKIEPRALSSMLIPQTVWATVSDDNGAKDPLR
jgi:adenine-specific DNA-methyltransferase